MNRVDTEDKIVWSVGLGKSAEQLVEHHKNAAELIILRNWIERGKFPQRKNMAGDSGALWKLWTNFKNLRIEIDLTKRKKRIDEFNSINQIVIQRSLLNEMLQFLYEYADILVRLRHLIGFENDSIGPG